MGTIYEPGTDRHVQCIILYVIIILQLTETVVLIYIPIIF